MGATSLCSCFPQVYFAPFFFCLFRLRVIVVIELNCEIHIAHNLRIKLLKWNLSTSFVLWCCDVMEPVVPVRGALVEWSHVEPVMFKRCLTAQAGNTLNNVDELVSSAVLTPPPGRRGDTWPAAREGSRRKVWAQLSSENGWEGSQWKVSFFHSGTFILCVILKAYRHKFGRWDGGKRHMWIPSSAVLRGRMSLQHFIIDIVSLQFHHGNNYRLVR